MDLAAETPANNGVPELMDGLDRHQACIHEKQVIGGKNALRLIRRLVKSFGHHLYRPSHHCEPQNRPQGRDEPSEDRHQPFQKIIRVEEGNADEHDAEEFGLYLPPAPFPVAFKQLGAVRGHFKVEEIGKIELGQQLEDVLLAGGAVGVSFQTFVPDLLHRAI
jgi:hypothetical protein